jgi:RNase P subunit RPR2
VNNTIRLDGDNFCPVCGHKIDAVTSMDGDVRVPTDGDVSICGECTAFLVFDKNLQSQLLTPDELLTLPDDIINTLAEIRYQLHSYRQEQSDDK